MTYLISINENLSHIIEDVFEISIRDEDVVFYDKRDNLVTLFRLDEIVGFSREKDRYCFLPF